MLISSQRRCSHSDSEKGSGPQTVKGPGSSDRNGLPLGPGTALRPACPHCTGCRPQGPRGSMPKVHFLWWYLPSWGYSADPRSHTTSPERAWAGQRNGPQAHPCPLIQRRGAAAREQGTQQTHKAGPDLLRAPTAHWTSWSHEGCPGLSPSPRGAIPCLTSGEAPNWGLLTSPEQLQPQHGPHPRYLCACLACPITPSLLWDALGLPHLSGL